MANSINDTLENELQITEAMKKDLKKENSWNSRNIELVVQHRDLEVGYLEFMEIIEPDGPTFKIQM